MGPMPVKFLPCLCFRGNIQIQSPSLACQAHTCLEQEGAGEGDLLPNVGELVQAPLTERTLGLRRREMDERTDFCLLEVVQDQ